MSLIVMLSVFNGFEDLVQSLYNSFSPDLEIKAAKGKSFVPDEGKLKLLQQVDGVEVYSKVLEEEGLVRFQDKQMIVTFKGVDDNFNKVTAIKDKIIRGDYILKSKRQDYAVFGISIEQTLGINSNYDRDSSVRIYLPVKGPVTSSTIQKPFVESKVRSGGAFSIQQDFDTKFTLLSLDLIQTMLRQNDEISGLEIKVKDGYDVSSVQEELEKIFGADFKIKDRYQQNEFLYKIMSSEKLAVYGIFTLVLLISAFNIIGSLVMLVISKRKDIFILKSMGCSDKRVRNIFLSEGFLITVFGGGIGMIAAILICMAQQYFGIIPIPGEGTFVIQYYPVELRPWDLVLIFCIIIIVGLIASWYPASRAAQTRSFIRTD